MTKLPTSPVEINASTTPKLTCPADSFAVAAASYARLALQNNELLTSPIPVSTSSSRARRLEELTEDFDIDPLPLPAPEKRQSTNPSLYLAEPEERMILVEGSIYKCRFDECEYESTRKFNSLRHARTHYESILVKCRVIDCGASFLDTNTGKEHLASVHGIGAGHKTREPEKKPAKQSGKKRKGSGESTSKAAKRKSSAESSPGPILSAESSPGPILSNEIPVATSILSSSPTMVASPIPSSSIISPTVSSLALDNNNEGDQIKRMAGNSFELGNKLYSFQACTNDASPNAKPVRAHSSSPHAIHASQACFPEPEQEVSSKE